MSEIPEQEIPELSERRSGSGLAVTSLILGILAVLLGLLFFPLGIILGLSGFVCGFLGLGTPGRGYAIGGMITSGLGVLAGLTIAGFAALFVTVATRQPRPPAREMVRSDLRNIHAAAEMVFVQTGSYPKSLDDLVHPIDAVGDPIPGALDEYPIDPWGNDYGYELRDGKPVITCLGRDGLPGGEGADADIHYPESDPGF